MSYHGFVQFGSEKWRMRVDPEERLSTSDGVSR